MSPCVLFLQLYILHFVYSQDGELTIFVGDIAPAIHEVKVKASQVRTYSIVNISRPNALDYDAVNDVLYWTDINLKQIWARNSRTFQTRHIFTSNSSSDLNDLTVDASIGKIFYTDGGLDLIGTINTDGSNSEIIVRDGLDEPRAIVLHEAIRKMYWTDWGKTPYIAEADYNGSNIVKIVTTGIAWPNGLTIDKQNKVLYWCDAKTHKIEAVNVNGTQRRLVLSEPPVHYFDIFYINEDLFFTDWHRKLIMNVPSTGGTVGNIGSGAFVTLTGLYVHSTINVSACVPGEYGASCRKCGHCKDDFVCERNTGLCLTGCLPGYQNRDCSLPCSDGTFGHKCESSCGKCASGGCDNVNGSCPQGCSPGWQGLDCKTSCSDGTYGDKCKSSCGECASGGCDIVNGSCPQGCSPGWQGHDCKTPCSDGTFGQMCESSCGKCASGGCDIVNGSCQQGCSPGWQGLDCKTTCSDGTYGDKCKSSCGQCASGGCDIVNGTCLQGCSPGWQGHDCKTPCSDGTFGQKCESSCGKCASGGCDIVNGSCLQGCSPGWQGHDCKTSCSDGTYGDKCKSSCGECASGGCDIVNGTCLNGCTPGWQGHDCKKSCSDGTFGQKCESSCGKCASGGCDIVNGTCLQGCSPGWQGHDCKTAKTSKDEERGTDGSHKDDTVSSNHVLIIGAVAGGLVVLLILVVVLIVILIFLFRRKRPHWREQNTDYCTLDRNRQSNIYAVPSDLPPAYATVENQQVGASAEYSHLYDAQDSEYATLPIPNPQPSSDYDDNYLHPVSIAVKDSDKKFTAFA